MEKRVCLVDYYKEPSYGYAGVSGEFPHYRIEIKTDVAVLIH